MRTVQQYYDDNRDKILFDVRALEEYEKETIEASIHYYWEDMIKVLEDNKEEPFVLIDTVDAAESSSGQYEYTLKDLAPNTKYRYAITSGYT